MPGAGRFTIAELAGQAKSIHPAAKQLIAGMKPQRRREEGRIMSYEMVKERIKELGARIQADSEETGLILRRLAAGSQDG